MNRLSAKPRCLAVLACLTVLLGLAATPAAYAGWTSTAVTSVPAVSAAALTAPVIACRNESEGLLNLSRYAVISWPRIEGATAYRVYITAGNTTRTVDPDVAQPADAPTVEAPLRANLLSTLLGNLLVGTPRIHVTARVGTNWESPVSNMKTLDLSILGLLPPLAGGIRCGT